MRELAAATLSGLIKGLPDSAAAALRARFLDSVSTLFPRRVRRRTAAGAAAAATAPAGPSLAERHAAVLGLRAFVLSTPYDVPHWLPGVLMALVPLAAEQPPVRSVDGQCLLH